jgi:hypothetical protein
MTEEQKKLFAEEIRIICKKYNLENVIIGCEEGDKFHGFYCFDKDPVSFQEYMSAVANSARLYQSAREKTMLVFDRMARFNG